MILNLIKKAFNFSRVKEKHSIEDRILYIVRNNNSEIAIKKLLGYYEFHYGNDTLINETAKLYINIGNKSKAGKYLFLKPNPTKQDQECIGLYVSSLGGNKIKILRDQLVKNTKTPKTLNLYAKKKLLNIMNEVKVETGTIPKFARNWYNHFNKV